MPKNIVICCDGTLNKFSHNQNTNIVHIYSCLVHDPSQISYYTPGVGTLPPDWITNHFAKKLDKKLGSFFGRSLDGNVMECYKYLMDIYEKGDKVYLFGFSRGAYTVRMLCGLIHMFGLLHKGNFNHSRYILADYKHVHKRFKLANRFKYVFSRKIEIHFMGIWDTVVSIGLPWNSDVYFPFSHKLSNVKHVRHAIAIDETRKHYSYFSVEKGHPDLKETFFSGVHSDIGGGYPEEGLSKISLEWMLGEASHLGLRLDSRKVDRYVLGVGGFFQKSDISAKIHDPYQDIEQRLIEYIPRRTAAFSKGPNNSIVKKYSTWKWKVKSPRNIPSGSSIHWTVFEKMKLKNSYHTYMPKNIQQEAIYAIEKDQNIKYH